MINALHLLWIIPVVAMFGFLMAALLSANNTDINQKTIAKETLNNIEKDIYKSMPLAYAEKTIEIIQNNISKTIKKLTNKP